MNYTPVPDTAEAHIADLKRRGFRVLKKSPRNPALRPGARVRNAGHQWYEAQLHGTATVVAVLRRGTDKNPDSWERSWGRPNIEVVVEHDEGRRDPFRFGVWSDYGSPLADEQVTS